MLIALCVLLSACAEKSNVSQTSDFENLKTSYCATAVSAEDVAQHFFSHFGVCGPDPQNFDEQVALGAPWERTAGMPIVLENIGDENELLKMVDTRVMRAQLKGIWQLLELYVGPTIDDLERVSHFLRVLAERYDGDGVSDMPCLKYPVKYFAVGNEISGAFVGQSDKFLSVLQTCHDAVTTANPDAKLVQAGMVPLRVNSNEVILWDSLFAKGAATYLDIAAFHELQGWESFSDLIYYRDYFSQRLPSKPTWITELQFEETTIAPSLTAKEYAPIHIRYLTYALAHGIDKMFFVNYSVPADGKAPFTEASAFIDSNGRRTELFTVVQRFIKEFDHFEAAEVLAETIEDGSYDTKPVPTAYKKVTAGQYRFKVDGQWSYVLWGSGALPAELQNRVQVTDIYGATSVVQANSIVLTSTPIYVRAGG
jgi:hypothetical protein